MKSWDVKHKLEKNDSSSDDIVGQILKTRGITTQTEIDDFLHPVHPENWTADDVGIDREELQKAQKRITKAIKNKESIVVYTDYDADGLTSGAIIWQTIHALSGNIMPYVPHRVDEGYGLTKIGIDTIAKDYRPSLLITVDNGITGYKEVKYAKSKGMDVIVTDHHIKPEKLPDCTIVHTTSLSGAGIAFFLAKELVSICPPCLAGRRASSVFSPQLLSLSAIGTIADMMPLLGLNRSLAKYGLDEINKRKNIGLDALIEEGGLVKGQISSYHISHIIAPRLNAVGRIVHAIDGLRLLCTTSKDRARDLAKKLGFTNRERQQMTLDSSIHAKELVRKMYGGKIGKKILLISHHSYNQGIIGLVAGKLVEEYYLPSIVISEGEEVSKASARSIRGFNIVEAIRRFSDLLIDVGGHPLAAGFTIKTKNIDGLRKKLEELAEQDITDTMRNRSLSIDLEMPIGYVTEELYEKIQTLTPFGFGNPEPVFATRGVKVLDVRKIGVDGKHLKLRLVSRSEAIKQFNNYYIDAIAFNMGNLYSDLTSNQLIDIAYTIGIDEWNGKKGLQLIIRDLCPSVFLQL
jgi:single-stranded-DNA-specific exonuclease